RSLIREPRAVNQEAAGVLGLVQGAQDTPDLGLDVAVRVDLLSAQINTHLTVEPVDVTDLGEVVRLDPAAERLQINDPVGNCDSFSIQDNRHHKSPLERV